MSYPSPLIILVFGLQLTGTFSTCPNGAKPFPSSKVGKGKINYADLFSITYYGTYKVIEYSSTLSMYNSYHPDASLAGKAIPPVVLYQCGTTRPSHGDAGITTSEVRFFEIPIQSATLGWGGPLPFFELLSVTETISVIDLSYISSPCTQLLETCIPGIHMKTSNANWSSKASQTDVAFTDSFGTGWAGAAIDIPFQISLDPGSLQRAEWIRFVAAFFNEEDKADQMFSEIQTDYNALKGMAEQLSTDSRTEWAGQKPKVAWITKDWSGNLKFNNAKYKIDFVEDAGGKMVPLPANPPKGCTFGSNSDGAKTLSCPSSNATAVSSFKTFLAEADVIIDDAYVAKYVPITTVNFSKTYLVTSAEIPALARNPPSVFRLDRTISDNVGAEKQIGSMWFEQMPSQPQQLLAGMMEAFWSNNFQTTCGFKYLRRIAGQESGQTVLGHDDCPYYAANGNHTCAEIHNHMHEVLKCSLGATTSFALATTPTNVAVVDGSLKFTSKTLTKGQVELGVKKALAQHMDVLESAVTVTATETRRLNSLQADRRLAGAWSVVFTVHVQKSQATAATAKVNEISADATSFNQVMKTSLMSLGVSETDATISVTSFSATVQKRGGTNSAPNCRLTFLVFFVVAFAMRR